MKLITKRIRILIAARLRFKRKSAKKVIIWTRLQIKAYGLRQKQRQWRVSKGHLSIMDLPSYLVKYIIRNANFCCLQMMTASCKLSVHQRISILTIQILATYPNSSTASIKIVKLKFRTKVRPLQFLVSQIYLSTSLSTMKNYR